MVKKIIEKPVEASLALRPEQTLQHGELIPSMEAYNLIKTQAAELIRTGFLPKHLDTPEKAAAVVLIGRELGIPMMQALRKVYVVNGTPALASELMLALCNRTGLVQDFTHKDDGQTCTVTLTRKGRTPYVATFSMVDARAMGLEGKDNWKKQASVMRYNRAMSKACRAVFPDATMGMYPLEEIAPDIQVDTSGSPIGGALPVEATLVQPAKPKAVAAVLEEQPEAGEGAKISEPDRKKLWERAKAKGVTPDALRTYLKSHFNVDSGTDIPLEKVPQVQKWVEDHPGAASGEAQA